MQHAMAGLRSRMEVRMLQSHQILALASALALIGFDAADGRAQDAIVAQGREIVVANCARCHAVERLGDSPLAAAPPFRKLNERYPVENLREALAEGIVTGHAAMPEFTFTADEVDALIAYLESLER